MDKAIASPIELTAADRVVLDSYKVLCEGLSEYLGDSYEVVLHSLEDFDKSIIKIMNGQLTKRKEGAPITDFALKMLEEMKNERHTDHISYFSKNKNREPMHSCTITVKGENDRVIGFMCINLALNTPLHRFIGNLLDEKANSASESCNENFADNPFDLISDSVAQVRSDVMSDETVTAQNRNKEIIVRLAARGIFTFKDSVQACANLLGISKNTVYMHLRNSNT